MSRRKRKSRRRRSHIDLEDLFDLDDFLKGREFDWDEWRKLRRRVIVEESKKPDTGFPIGLGIAVIVFALLAGSG